MSTLFFDTETTGLPNKKEPSIDPCQPNLLQLGAILYDDENKIAAEANFIVRPLFDYDIHPKALEAHGITLDRAYKYGVAHSDVFWIFQNLVSMADNVVAHNIWFDRIIMERVSAIEEYDVNLFENKNMLCTMETATPILKIPSPWDTKWDKGKKGKKSKRRKRSYKWPSLQESSEYFLGHGFEDAHDAMVDIRVCADIYYKMLEMGVEVHG